MSSLAFKDGDMGMVLSLSFCPSGWESKKLHDSLGNTTLSSYWELGDWIVFLFSGAFYYGYGLRNRS